MNRRTFLQLASASALSNAALPATAKPNVLLIVADDLGYAEIGVQGCTDIPTPNIDSIAKNGVRFTSGYVSCPVCSPTRAGLMTGRYQQRFGHEFNPGPATEASSNFGLSLSEPTIAERLKKLGYTTGMVGKWHLGYRPEFLPTRRGFDEFFGFPGGAHSYFDEDRGGNPVMRGTKPAPEEEYLTDAFAREAKGFLDRNHSKPFFLYLPFNAVHTPMHATEKYKSRFPSIKDEQRRTYAAMMCAMDDAIGGVLAKLRQYKLEDDTLVIFHSDNGGPTPINTSKNTPLRGYKGGVYEGGIRVPFLMQWKSRIAANQTVHNPVISLDIHPTIVKAAGGEAAPNLDGRDLMPMLTRSGSAPHDSLFWRYGRQWAVRSGDWKLVNAGERTELYNLAADISESRPVEDPARSKALQSAYDDWNRGNIAAKWATAPRGGKKKGKKR